MILCPQWIVASNLFFMWWLNLWPLTTLLCRWVGGRPVGPQRNDPGLLLLLQLPLGHHTDGAAGGPEAWLQPVWGPQDLETCRRTVELSHFLPCVHLPHATAFDSVLFSVAVMPEAELCFCYCSFHQNEIVLNLVCWLTVTIGAMTSSYPVHWQTLVVRAWHVTVCSTNQFTLNHCLVLKFDFNLYFFFSPCALMRHLRSVSIIAIHFMIAHWLIVCVQCECVTLKYIYIQTKICKVRCTVFIFEHRLFFALHCV